eukprot:NODE_4097_length_1231_cov_33.925090_g3601_i0.p1 GENE.NODE_4097_length_1231_cov_33.925090_g3601_i0~~NODE_4097_length_1231_cov_33.925090_g3601_i0.p1  ORF type:complete len:385 (-),score=112.62 NODE_4097_length_1231_cov_33.925090_g3601_i0:76-1200(-)
MCSHCKRRREFSIPIYKTGAQVVLLHNKIACLDEVIRRTLFLVEDGKSKQELNQLITQMKQLTLFGQVIGIVNGYFPSSEVYLLKLLDGSQFFCPANYLQSGTNRWICERCKFSNMEGEPICKLCRLNRDEEEEKARKEKERREKEREKEKEKERKEKEKKDKDKEKDKDKDKDKEKSKDKDKDKDKEKKDKDKKDKAKDKKDKDKDKEKRKRSTSKDKEKTKERKRSKSAEKKKEEEKGKEEIKPQEAEATSTALVVHKEPDEKDLDSLWLESKKKRTEEREARMAQRKLQQLLNPRETYTTTTTVPKSTISSQPTYTVSGYHNPLPAAHFGMPPQGYVPTPMMAPYASFPPSVPVYPPQMPSPAFYPPMFPS